MPPTQEQEHEGRVGSLEMKMGLFDYRLSKNEAILQKIEENLTKITILIEKHQVLREDLTTLETQFKERKNKTDPVLDMAERTIGKIQGAGLIIALLLGVLIWEATSTISRVGSLEKEQKAIAVEVQKIKSELEANVSEDSKVHPLVTK